MRCALRTGVISTCLAMIIGCPNDPQPPAAATPSPSAAQPAAAGEAGASAASKPAAARIPHAGADTEVQKALAPPKVAAVPLPPGFSPRRLRDMTMGQLDTQPFLGRLINVEYGIARADAGQRPGAPPQVLRLVVTRVSVDVRRFGQRVELDSADPGERKRVENGAETTNFFDAVIPFALLDVPLVAHLNGGGRVTRLEGGDAVRQRLLALFPPKPRESPRNIARVAVAAADDRLIELLFPPGAVGPERGALDPNRRLDVDTREEREDYSVDVAQATLIKSDPKGVRLITKRIDKPTTRKPSVPPPDDGSSTTFRTGRGEMTLTFDPAAPERFEGGADDERELEWTGEIEGKTERRLVHLRQTRTWTEGPASH